MNAPERGDFTKQADAYAVARPGYPPALVDALCELAGVERGDPVADVGAGTGLLTELLVERGLRVRAIEPNAKMRELGSAGSSATWSDGTFEATGLGDASQAWVTAAQAFHWADPARALPELARVLRPGGALTILFNERDASRSEVLAWTRELIHELVPGFDEGYRDRDWSMVLRSTGHFDRIETRSVEHAVLMSRARYLDLWRSHHLLSRAAGDDGMRALVGAIEERLPDAPIDVTYVCRSWTARRG